MYKIYTLEELEENFGKMKDIDEDFIEDKDGEYFVIKVQDSLVGYILVDEDERCYLIRRIFVRAGMRYKSYGMKLIKFLVNHGIEQKKEKIICIDFSKQDFFKKNGFKENYS